MNNRFVIVFDTTADVRVVWLSVRAAQGQGRGHRVNIFETIKEAREHVARSVGKSVGARWILDLETGKTYSVGQ